MSWFAIYFAVSAGFIGGYVARSLVLHWREETEDGGAE